MLHRRLTCPIGDRHACSETDMPDRRPTCPIGDRYACGVSTHLNTFIFVYFLLIYIYIHIGIIYWDMVVSDGSPMKHVAVSDGFPIIIIFS